MINLADQNVKKLIDALHKYVERKSKNLSSSDHDNYVKENRVIKILCEDKSLAPRVCAEEMNDRYGTDLNGEDIINILKANRLSYQAKRAELMTWAEEIVNAIVKVIETRKQKDYEDFITLRNKNILTRDNERYKLQERIACLMFYVRCPELDSGTDAATIEKFGNAYMKHFLYDLSDFIKNIFVKNRIGNRNDKKNSSQDKIEMLENMLNRSDLLLKDLQDEFEARINQSHQDDMIEFFSHLNSEKYGCLLDAVLNVRNGVKQLLRKGVQLPPEIGGLLILVERFAQFIHDSEINPILRPGSVRDMKLDEVESCDYEGSPFADANDVKHVKVLSPGWVYKNKDVQISRPRLQEVKDDSKESAPLG
ncbi:MAG: hypothetical protein K6G55_02005 [Selenomonadaceae bacterium]|nr:hypothetical protein [Selenomonadaceae bacterium]